MSSLNEIAEACMSEVVENSVRWCANWLSCNTGYAPMLTTEWYEQTDTDIELNLQCECVWGG